jgi:hypothetical protein
VELLGAVAVESGGTYPPLPRGLSPKEEALRTKLGVARSSSLGLLLLAAVESSIAEEEWLDEKRPPRFVLVVAVVVFVPELGVKLEEDVNEIDRFIVRPPPRPPLGKYPMIDFFNFFLFILFSWSALEYNTVPSRG